MSHHDSHEVITRALRRDGILVYVLLTAVEGIQLTDTTYLTRCVTTLEQAFEELGRHDPDEILWDIFHAAWVTESFLADARGLAAMIGNPTDG